MKVYLVNIFIDNNEPYEDYNHDEKCMCVCKTREKAIETIENYNIDEDPNMFDGWCGYQHFSENKIKSDSIEPKYTKKGIAWFRRIVIDDGWVEWTIDLSIEEKEVIE